MRRIGVWFALLLVSLLAATAGVSANVTAALQGQTSDFQSIVPLLEEWSEKTGIESESVGFPAASFTNTLISGWEAGSDRFDFVQGGPLATFVEAGYVVPLDGSYDPEIKIPDKLLDSYFPGVLDLATYEGNPYLLYYSTDANPFFYRKDLFEQAGLPGAPKDRGDLVEYGKKLTADKDGDGIIDQWGFAWWLKPQTNSIGMWFYNQLRSDGGRVVDSDGDLAFNSPEGVKALTFMYDLLNTHKISPPASLAWYQNEQYQAARVGQLAMWQSGNWTYTPLNLEDDSPIKGTVGVAAFPKGSVTSAVSLGGNAFYLAANSKNQVEAFQAMLYLVSEESQVFMSEMGLDYSGRRDIYQNEGVRARAPEMYDAYAKLLEGGYRMPRFVGSERVEEIIAKHAHRALLEVVTPEKALDDARNEIRRELGI